MEDTLFVRNAVSIGIFKDENPVLGFAGAFWIVCILQHPKAAAVVHGVGDGLHDIRFRGEDLHLESLRNLHFFGRLRRWKRLGGGDGAAFVLQRIGGEPG